MPNTQLTTCLKHATTSCSLNLWNVGCCHYSTTRTWITGKSTPREDVKWDDDARFKARGLPPEWHASETERWLWITVPQRGIRTAITLNWLKSDLTRYFSVGVCFLGSPFSDPPFGDSDLGQEHIVRDIIRCEVQAGRSEVLPASSNRKADVKSHLPTPMEKDPPTPNPWNVLSWCF